MRETQNREIRKYHYPSWVESAVKIEQLNVNPISLVYASILHDTFRNSHITFLDMRVWKNGEPTSAGLYINRSAALALRDVLDQFINGDLIEDDSDLR